MNLAEKFAHAGRLVDGDDIDARHHDVVDAEIGELDDVEHHRLGFRAYRLAGVLRAMGLERALEAFAQPHFTLAAEARAQAPPQTVTPRVA